MGIISIQIVNENRSKSWKRCIQIAIKMSCSSEISSQMTMISNFFFFFLDFFLAKPTDVFFLKSLFFLLFSKLFSSSFFLQRFSFFHNFFHLLCQFLQKNLSNVISFFSSKKKTGENSTPMLETGRKQKLQGMCC